VIGWSAHLSTLFGELPPLARPAAGPPRPGVGAWVAAVRAAGVRAELVNAFGGDLAAGAGRVGLEFIPDGPTPASLASLREPGT
jgi:hypothetical protein